MPRPRFCPEARRILILRPDNIGDFILFSGALVHLRALYPQSRLTLAVQPHVVELASLQPSVDEVLPLSRLVISKRGRTAGSYEVRKALRAIQRVWRLFRKPYDLVLYPVRSPQVAHLRLLRDLRVPWVVGIAGCGANEPKGGYPSDLAPRTLFCQAFDVSGSDPWRHEFLTTLDYLHYLGCEVSGVADLQPRLHVPEQTSLLKREGGAGRWIGIFPGGSNPLNAWEPGNYATLAAAFGKGFRYAILGGGEGTELCRRVEVALKQGGAEVVLNLAGMTSLSELYRCLADCQAVVSMDSVGLHLSIAAGVPTVGIEGEACHGRFARWGDPEQHRVLAAMTDCYGCYWRCRRGQAECIQAVSPGEVFDALRAVLADPHGNRNRAAPS